MPLALIVNELLTNAAKHSLRDGKGTITVSLKPSTEGMELRVEDEGPGYEYKPNGKRSSGLGLVAGLARQLRGSFTVERGGGARCIVRFPIRPSA
jgi:two-component sensor histidine kinase